MPSFEEAKKVVAAKNALESHLNRPDWMRGIGTDQDETGKFCILVEVATEEDFSKVPPEWEGVRVKAEVFIPEDGTFFSCGGDCPKGGEHDWNGPTVILKSYCYRCDGQGCKLCDNGEYVSGESGSCSKCRLTSIDHDMMNGP